MAVIDPIWRDWMREQQRLRDRYESTRPVRQPRPTPEQQEARDLREWRRVLGDGANG